MILSEGGGQLRLTVRGIVINRNTGKILLIKYFDKYSKSTKEFIDGFGFYQVVVLKEMKLLKKQ